MEPRIFGLDSNLFPRVSSSDTLPHIEDFNKSRGQFCATAFLPVEPKTFLAWVVHSTTAHAAQTNFLIILCSRFPPDQSNPALCKY
eukprot:2430734-Amphidinium_carterae.1